MESPSNKNTHRDFATSQSEQKHSKGTGSGSNFFWLKKKKPQSEFSSEDHHNNFDEDEVDRLSRGSYDKRHKDNIFIAKNNLKLSLLMNLFLFVGLGLILIFNWYHYKGGNPKNEQVWFKIFLTRVEGQGLVSIDNYVKKGCPNLSRTLPDVD